jgi:hypothetical protein
MIVVMIIIVMVVMTSALEGATPSPTVAITKHVF